MFPMRETTSFRSYWPVKSISTAAPQSDRRNRSAYSVAYAALGQRSRLEGMCVRDLTHMSASACESVLAESLTRMGLVESGAVARGDLPQGPAPRTLADAVTLARTLGHPVAGPSWPVVTNREPSSGDMFAVALHHDGTQPWAVGFRPSPSSSDRRATEWRLTEFLVQQVEMAAQLGMTGETIRSLPIGELLATARQAASARSREEKDGSSASG